MVFCIIWMGEVVGIGLGIILGTGLERMEERGVLKGYWEIKGFHFGSGRVGKD